MQRFSSLHLSRGQLEVIAPSRSHLDTTKIQKISLPPNKIEKMLKDADKIINLFISGMSVKDISKETDSSTWYCEKILKSARLL